MKKGKKIIYIMIVIAMLILQQHQLYAKTKEEKKQIQKLVEKYFDKRYGMLSSLTWDDGIQDFFIPLNINGVQEKDVLQTVIEYRKLQQTDLRFKKYRYKLQYDNIEISGKEATVILYESSSKNFYCSENIKSEMSGAKHTFLLNKYKNEWKIKEHDYDDEIKERLQAYYNQYGSIEQAKEKIFGQATRQQKQYRDIDNLVRQNKYDQEKEKMSIQKDVGNGFWFYGYDIDGAVAYALQYALEMNPKYADYEKMGGDCTNFTSQCLHAGKIPFDTVGKDEMYKWYWYSQTSRTPSWSGASAFQFYVENNNKNDISIGLKAHSSTLKDILRGDIIQRIEENGLAGHSMICTGYVVKDGWLIDYLISQHSGYDEDHRRRLKNYPLSLKEGNKIFWSIDGYYQYKK